MELVTFVFDRKITLEAFHVVLVPIINKHMNKKHVFSVSLDTDEGRIMDWYLKSRDYPNILYTVDTYIYTHSYLMNTHLIVFSMFTGKNRRPNKIIRQENKYECSKMEYEETNYGDLYTRYRHKSSNSHPSPLLLIATLEREIYRYMKEAYNDEDIDIRVLLDDETTQNQVLAMNLFMDGELKNMDLHPYWVRSLIENYYA